MSFKEYLEGKITDGEQFSEMLYRYTHYSVTEYIRNHRTMLGMATNNLSFNSEGLLLTGFSTVSVTDWWVAREIARFKQGVYESNDILKALNESLGMFIHVSKTDKTKVAYTPDRQAGEQDRQLAISLGRLLQRQMPQWGDEVIRGLAEANQALANMEIQFASGRQIAEIYMEMGSDRGACMSNSKFNLKPEYHPAGVYEAEYVRLAYSRNAGKISGRALVYEPPGKDPVYIRSYLSAAFRKQLEALGYKPGSLAGAKLKRIDIPEQAGAGGEGTVGAVIPYIDGNNSTGDSNVSSVALMEDCVYVVPPKLQPVFRSKGINLYTATSTAGMFHRVPASWASFIVKDALTGEDINPLMDDVHNVWVNGEVKQTKQAIVPLMYHEAQDTDWITVMEARGKSTVIARKADTVKLPGQIFTLNTESAITSYGYVAADPRLYPDEPWMRTHQVTMAYAKIEDKWVLTNVNKHYLVRYVYGNSASAFDNPIIKKILTEAHPGKTDAELIDILSNQTPAGESDGKQVRAILVRTPDHKTVKFGKNLMSLSTNEAYCADPSLVVVTRSGRKAVPGFSAVGKDIYGVWDFSRNMYNVYSELDGGIHHVSRTVGSERVAKQMVREWLLSESAWQLAYNSNLALVQRLISASHDLNHNAVMDMMPVEARTSNYRYIASYIRSMTLAEQAKLAERLTNTSSLDMYMQLRKAYQYLLADAAAVEHPDRLVDLPTQAATEAASEVAPEPIIETVTAEA